MFSQNLPIERVSSEGSSIVRVVDGWVGPRGSPRRQILLEVETRCLELVTRQSQSKSESSFKTSHNKTRIKNESENHRKQTTKYKHYCLSSEWVLRSERHLPSLCSKDVVRSTASNPAIKALSAGHTMDRTTSYETNQKISFKTDLKQVLKSQKKFTKCVLTWMEKQAFKKTDKGKFVLVYDIKADTGNTDITPLILSLKTRLR